MDASRMHGSNVTFLDPLELVTSRLDSVRKAGRGFSARCPAHEDKTASLSISSGDDGRVLLNCFAGCGAADVLAAIGLQMADLFPRRPTANMDHRERAQLREYAKQARWQAALNVLPLECTVILVCAAMVTRGEPVSPEDQERVNLAAQRIADARAVFLAR